jgi:hypothetical protein
MNLLGKKICEFYMKITHYYGWFVYCNNFNSVIALREHLIPLDPGTLGMKNPDFTQSQ